MIKDFSFKTLLLQSMNVLNKVVDLEIKYKGKVEWRISNINKILKCWTLEFDQSDQTSQSLKVSLTNQVLKALK